MRVARPFVHVGLEMQMALAPLDISLLDETTIVTKLSADGMPTGWRIER